VWPLKAHADVCQFDRLLAMGTNQFGLEVGAARLMGEQQWWSFCRCAPAVTPLHQGKHHWIEGAAFVGEPVLIAARCLLVGVQAEDAEFQQALKPVRQDIAGQLQRGSEIFKAP
jgi:hypothetical protein